MENSAFLVVVQIAGIYEILPNNTHVLLLNSVSYFSIICNEKQDIAMWIEIYSQKLNTPCIFLTIDLHLNIIRWNLFHNCLIS